MAPILANAEVQERLMPYLPSGESLPQTAEEIQNTLTSPQFQQVGARHGNCSFSFPHDSLFWVFEGPDTVQSRKLLCGSEKEPGHDLIEP